VGLRHHHRQPVVGLAKHLAIPQALLRLWLQTEITCSKRVAAGVSFALIGPEGLACRKDREVGVLGQARPAKAQPAKARERGGGGAAHVSPPDEDVIGAVGQNDAPWRSSAMGTEFPRDAKSLERGGRRNLAVGAHSTRPRIPPIHDGSMWPKGSAAGRG